MPSLDRATARRDWSPLRLVAALLLSGAGCDGDSLYSEGEVTGPVRTVASHTVALSVPVTPSVAMGDSIPVSVFFEAGERSGGIARVGVTALAIHGAGRDTTVLRASETFATPRTGSGRVSLLLRPLPAPTGPPPHPFRLEVFAHAVAANGACAAAVESTPQQLACATLRGDTIAFGAAGFTREVTLVAPHTVSLVLTAPELAERDDTLAVARVTAHSAGGPGGIVGLGITGIVTTPSGRPLATVGDSVRYAAPGVSTADHTFHLTAAELARRAGLTRLPDSVKIEIHAFALHSSGGCVAAATNAPQRLPCTLRGAARVADTPLSQPVTVVLVLGRSASLPGGAPRIAALTIDPRTDRAFLSNPAAHQVEVLDLSSMTFRSPVSVGSQPAGVALNRTGDTLIVANSGGINISFVPTATLREDLSRRLELSRLRLFEVKEDDHTDAIFYSYSDRPMFVEQDAAGRLLYTTVTTRSAPVGTIRVAERQSGWATWEPYLLFHERSLRAAAGWVSVANVDSLRIVSKEAVVLFDHLPGFPDARIQSAPAPVVEAVAQLRRLGSDAIAIEDFRWDLPRSLELSDTSFIAISEDRRVALFGEGVRTPGGRLLFWSSDSARLSQVEDVRDLTHNTSDPVTSIDLNFDGSLGAMRGQRGIYFFGSSLRLRGTTAATAGGSGIGLLGGPGPSTQLAFGGTEGPSIRVIETTHFRTLGELRIRDRVAGPMEVARPLPGENAGRACGADPLLSDPECLLARIVAGTSGGVVYLEIRARDVQEMVR